MSFTVRRLARSRFTAAALLSLVGCSPLAYGQGGDGSPVTGACCITCAASASQTSCTRVTAASCISMGGRYKGDNTSCAPAALDRCTCEIDTTSTNISKRTSVNQILLPPGNETDQPIVAPGAMCGGRIACAPNPNKHFRIDMNVTELRNTGPTAGPGGLGFRLSGSPLTALAAYGEGLPGGYPEGVRPPCAALNSPPAGLYFPFRDSFDNPSPGVPCESTNPFTFDEGSSGVYASLRGEARGGPLETHPGYPMDLGVYGRGVFDEDGNVTVGSVRITTLSGPQRLLRFRITGGTIDVIDFPEPPGGGGGGSPVCISNVPVGQAEFLKVIPGATPLPGGAAINGIAAVDFGEFAFPPLAQQNTQTSAGDKSEFDSQTEGSEGSELDALYARVVTTDADGNPIPGKLHLFVTGNLRSNLAGNSVAAADPNYDNLDIFIDSIAGEGQHTLRGDNSGIDAGALNRMGEKSAVNGNTTDGPDGRGLTFENGCSPDFYTSVSLRTLDDRDFNLYVHHAELPTSGNGNGWFAGRINDNDFLTGGGTLTGGDAGAPLIRASMSNANFQGVIAGTGVAPFKGPGSGLPPVSGVELEIPLSAIGNPSGAFKVFAFINRKDHGFVSNQVLPGIGGGAALGEPREVDFGAAGGMQCVSVYPDKRPLWKNGDFDLQNSQTSQVGTDQDWNEFARITADDFYLCDGQIHAIDTITGKLTTDAVAPKAQIVIWPDCNGRPDITRPIAILSSAPQVFDGRPIHAVEGELIIRETGELFDGLRVISVEGHFAKPIFLRGGAYWVSIIGFSGTGNPLEQFFWGTAAGESGSPIVKGRPGQFYDSDVGQWVDIDLLCCGCTDFNFCIGGESCKLLFDNASPLLDSSNGVPGTPSLQNGSSTSVKSRSASDIVLSPCVQSEICYIEGYVWTNCDRIALQFFDPGCSCPNDSGHAGSGQYLADCIIDTGERYQVPNSNITLRLLKAVFYTFPSSPLPSGRDLWVSLYALGDNSQNARGFFALGDRCDHPCDVRFNPPCVRGPAFDIERWRSVPAPLGLYDHAFAVAIRPTEPEFQTVVVDTCPADTNRNGEVSVQDIFDFLTAWFAGCP